MDEKIIREHERIDQAECSALRLLCDNQFRKLAKVLPDVKAVELKGEVTTNVTVKFNP